MMSVNIANALSNVDVESHLCVTRFEGRLKSKINKKVNYLFLNKKTTLDLAAILRLKKYIKKNKIEIIHAHSSSYFIAYLMKMRFPNLILIWHDHYGNSEHLSKRAIQPLKFISNKIYAVISVNKHLKHWSKDNLKVNNVYYLPNFAKLKDDFNKTRLNGEKGKRIVCVAGLRPQKDHLNLLKAFKIIQTKNQDWTLHLIGNHYDDIYYQKIKTFLIEEDLLKSVFLYHNSTDIKNILSQSTIGVLSSISEGLPVSLLEYGLAELPVVVTNVGECGNVLENGKYGLLVQPSNSIELADNIIQLIDDVDLRTQFSDLFYKHVFENYSEEKFIDKLLKIYNN